MTGYPVARLRAQWRYSVPVIEYFVPGIPVPQGDLASNSRGILYHKNKALEPWRHQIAWRARRPMRDNGFGDVIFAGPISLSVLFVLRRVQGTAKRRATPPAIKKPDLDKLTRSIGDALTGVVWVDDSQIIHGEQEKVIGEIDEETGVWICVERVVILGDWVDGERTYDEWVQLANKGIRDNGTVESAAHDDQ